MQKKNNRHTGEVGGAFFLWCANTTEPALLCARLISRMEINYGSNELLCEMVLEVYFTFNCYCIVVLWLWWWWSWFMD